MDEETRAIRTRAEAGDAEAQAALGIRYSKGRGVDQDHAEAVHWFELAAEQGNVKAQWALSVHFRNGWGVEKDQARMLHYYRLAAAQKHLRAMLRLATLHRQGSEGADRDLAEVERLLREAADTGEAEGQYRYGVHLLGDGGDAEGGRAWLRKAAAQEHEMAMVDLGGIYEEGEGVKPDFAEAMQWFEKAAALGNETAQSCVESLRFRMGSRDD